MCLSINALDSMHEKVITLQSFEISTVKSFKQVVWSVIYVDRTSILQILIFHSKFFLSMFCGLLNFRTATVLTQTIYFVCVSEGHSYGGEVAHPDGRSDSHGGGSTSAAPGRHGFNAWHGLNAVSSAAPGRHGLSAWHGLNAVSDQIGRATVLLIC